VRKLLDETNESLQAVLDALIAEDMDITVREIARRHPQLKHPSAFTRSSERMALIGKARQRQEDARQVKLDPLAKRSATATEMLAARTAEVKVLEAQVQALVAASAACIRAVSQHGGMPALERFWREYKGIADTMRAVGAMPSGGQVIDMPPRQ
jgi:hypothetical protein